MTDLALHILNDAGGADLLLEKGDLALDEGLETAVLLSLFTDARADVDQDLPGEPGDVRGWWGETPSDPFGSRLWLVLERGKRSEEAETLAREYALEALQWMVDGGIVAGMDAAASFDAAGILRITVELTRGTSSRWEHLWRGQAGRALDVPGAQVKLLLR